ncbi:MAG: GTP 3',8-cyclase MoaA [Saezia sp.]
MNAVNSQNTTSIIDARADALLTPVITKEDHAPFTTAILDSRQRPLHDLRISVTDRCNFRCSYCMPKHIFSQDHAFLKHSQLLSFEEINRLANAFLKLGVKKIRITGGEPLLRRHLENLVAQLAQLQTLDGTAPELTLTTNGTLLEKKAKVLKDAGLNRVTISLDALDDHIFQRLNDMKVPVATVLKGIDAALAAGLQPIKVNMVVRKGINEEQIIPMVKHFRNTGIILRFIEYMDVGSTNGWSMEEVIPSSAVIARIREHYDLHALDPNTPEETAERWAFDDGAGEIGVISSVTNAFCHSCSRARLSMEWRLFMCLFANAGYDLRELLRKDLNDASLQASIAKLWQKREDRYSELRGQVGSSRHHVEMSYIGG